MAPIRGVEQAFRLLLGLLMLLALVLVGAIAAPASVLAAGGDRGAPVCDYDLAAPVDVTADGSTADLAASPVRTAAVDVEYVYDSSADPVATNTADDLVGAMTRPAGVADDWVSEVAASGRGRVWRAPGTTGNAGTVRIMEPTVQYPNGYVRFYNEYGQPIGLNGVPGPNSATHIPLNVDGTYQLPKGWGG